MIMMNWIYGGAAAVGLVVFLYVGLVLTSDNMFFPGMQPEPSDYAIRYSLNRVGLEVQSLNEGDVQPASPIADTKIEGSASATGGWPFAVDDVQTGENTVSLRFFQVETFIEESDDGFPPTAYDPGYAQEQGYNGSIVETSLSNASGTVSVIRGGDGVDEQETVAEVSLSDLVGNESDASFPVTTELTFTAE